MAVATEDVGEHRRQIRRTPPTVPEHRDQPQRQPKRAFTRSRLGTLRHQPPPAYRWRNQFGGMSADDTKRLKDLGRENATLKQLHADGKLEQAALKEISRGSS